MTDKVGGLPNRGRTYYGPNVTISSSYGPNIGLEGQEQSFRDVDYSGGPGILAPRSNRENVCLLVRNASGINLLPKRVAKWKAGFRNKRVDGYCAIGEEACAGVVDEWLPSAGVRDGDLFWLCVKGPTQVLTDLAGADFNVINEGDLLVALTAATSQATTAGRVKSFVVTSNATFATTAAFNQFGRAMSAKTTANTNNSLLADVRFIQ